MADLEMHQPIGIGTIVRRAWKQKTPLNGQRTGTVQSIDEIQLIVRQFFQHRER